MTLYTLMNLWQDIFDAKICKIQFHSISCILQNTISLNIMQCNFSNRTILMTNTVIFTMKNV